MERNRFASALVLLVAALLYVWAARGASPGSASEPELSHAAPKLAHGSRARGAGGAAEGM